MFDPAAKTQVTTSIPELTERQQGVLDVLRSYAAEHGYPPTVREIGAMLGLASSSTVHSHLAALERAGVIERDPTKPRALKWGPSASSLGIDDGAVTGPGFGQQHMPESDASFDAGSGTSLPLLGRVAAGAPILADEHIEEYLPVPRRLTRNGTSFVLQVRGDSMIDAGIFDQDYVVVQRRPDARDGEIVVALVGDDAEATCKRFRRVAGRIELHSENAAYEPIVPDEVSIAGVVTGVMRAV